MMEVFKPASEIMKHWKDTIKNNDNLIVYFTMKGCYWCKPVKKFLKKFDKKYKDKVTIVTVNFMKYHDLANIYEIDGTPWVLIFKNGKIVREACLEGCPDEEEYELTMNKWKEVFGVV